MKLEFTFYELSSEFYIHKEIIADICSHAEIKNRTSISLEEILHSSIPTHYKYRVLIKKGLSVKMTIELVNSTLEKVAEIIIRKGGSKEEIELILKEVHVCLTNEVFIKDEPVLFYSETCFYLYYKFSVAILKIAKIARNVFGLPASNSEILPLPNFKQDIHGSAIRYRFKIIDDAISYFTVLPRIADEATEKNDNELSFEIEQIISLFYKKYSTTNQ